MSTNIQIDVQDLRKRGIAAQRAGRKAEARALLREALRLDGDDIEAWLWLSGAVESDAERIECLENALRIDPEHAGAARFLGRMIAGGRARVVLPAAAAPENGTNSNIPVDPDEEEIIDLFGPRMAPILVRSGLLLLAISAPTLFFWWLLDSGEMLCVGVYAVLTLLILTATVVIWIRNVTETYMLTEHQLLIQRGVFNRIERTYPLERIQDVSIRQGIMQRLMRMGHVEVESAGELGAARLRDVARPADVAANILQPNGL